MFLPRGKGEQYSKMYWFASGAARKRFLTGGLTTGDPMLQYRLKRFKIIFLSMTTIKEIAQKAGVSVGTVSNYLNSPEKVATKSSEAIRKVIQETSYHPRAAARSLKSNLTHRIGLVPVITSSDGQNMEPSDIAFLEFLAAVNSVAAQYGFDVLLPSVASNLDEVEVYDRLVGSREVDGLLVLNTQPVDTRIEFLIEKNFPFVSFGRSENHRHQAYLDLDGAFAMEESVDHLVNLGHSRIAYIAPKSDTMFARERWKGFSKAMGVHKLRIRDEYVVTGDFTEKSGQVAMHLLLDLAKPPSAVITPNDLCAFGAMHAMMLRGFTPGKDISIIGFDDIRLASHWQPSLTTIVQPFRQIGVQAMQMLVDLIEGKKAAMPVIIKPELVVRQSTGPAK